MGNLFVTLLNRSINAGWLILAVILLRILLKKAPKWMMCLLWGCVAFRLICPFSMESIFSLIPSRETLPSETVISASPRIDSGIGMVDNVINPVLQESFTPSVEESVNPLQIWLTAAGILWGIGAMVMLMFAFVSYIRLYLRIRTAVRVQEPVYTSEFVDMPFIFGLIRPRIYLPCDMSEEMRTSVIAHERAHLERRDYLWKVIGYGLLTAYWFHPFCWIGFSLFCKDIELACDEKVIREYDERQRRVYSEALLACSQGRNRTTLCPLAFGEVGIKERIQSVICYKKPAFRAIVAAMIVCVTVAVCLLTDPVKREEDPGENSSVNAGNSQGQPEEGAQQNNAEATSIPEGTGQEDGGEAGSNGQVSGRETEYATPEDLVNQWTGAFVGRDGDLIAALAAEELLADFRDRDLLSGPEGQRSFGMSSPWPLDAETDVTVYAIGDTQAEIYYYAWTSEPHVTIWKEELTYEKRDGGYVVTTESLIWYDDISSGETFAQLYGIPLQIEGTGMDYMATGAWADLCKNARQSSSELYQDLFEPESAVIRLLNLSDDPAKVKVDRIMEEEEEEIRLRIFFPEENMAVEVTMVQPDGKGGIWIPREYSEGPLYRFAQMDWEEVKRQAVPAQGDPNWQDILLLGEIPEADIAVYGYNDEEYKGRGVAIDVAGKVSYFDWFYTTTQALMPEFYWKEGERQLQAAFRIYTGTGVSSEALHVLQVYDNGTLQDNRFEINDYWKLLEERIGYTFDEDTGRLTMFDTVSGEELAAVEAEEKVTELELGAISNFKLGDEILLHMDTGYYVEGGAAARYGNMPSLEAEILLKQENGRILFTLGEIRVVE